MDDDRLTDVVDVRTSGGVVSAEMVDLSPGVARAYVRTSPRGLRLSPSESRNLFDGFLQHGSSRVYSHDSRRRLLRKACSQAGWRMQPAVASEVRRPHSIVSSHDLPLDEDLVDEHGRTPDLFNSGHMMGLAVDLGPRKAWAFYTDEGTTARIVSEGLRRWGMFVCYDPDDIQATSDTLLAFLASARKTWAVYSRNFEDLVRAYHPSVLSRMVLDGPVERDHSAVPVGRSNRKQVVALFSEYYDEHIVNSMVRMRSFEANKDFSVHAVEGGFVILRAEGKRGLIYDIYVTPSRQGQGLGDELLRCAVSQFSGRADSVYLHTSYPRARRLYEKHGFHEDYSHLAVRLDEQVMSTSPSR
jgi:ribosomal protein S18 acetylase RimI-like enzyme